MTETPPSRARSRTVLVTVLLVFAAPVILAWLVYFAFPEYRPASTMNHGQLVEPVRPLPDFSFTDLEGRPLDRAWLRGKWTWVYLATGPCNKACVEQLYKIRQVRLTQGKNIDRLQRLFLWDAGTAGADEKAELAGHFPGLRILALPAGEQATALLRTFSLDQAEPLSAGRVYLVDPLGNLMMSYEADADPRGLIKDIERLLKYSGLG